MIDQDTGPWPTCEPDLGAGDFARADAGESSPSPAADPAPALLTERGPPARVWRAIERQLRREGIIQD